LLVTRDLTKFALRLSGISVFEHHLKGFSQFTPMTGAGQRLKVIHYVGKELKREERERYFPTTIRK
jgi:hypothetical protein